MMKPNEFKQRKQHLEDAAANVSAPVLERIYLLTQLYFIHQFDVHSQARYVRQIEDLSLAASGSAAATTR